MNKCPSIFLMPSFKYSGVKECTVFWVVYCVCSMYVSHPDNAEAQGFQGVAAPFPVLLGAVDSVTN